MSSVPGFDEMLAELRRIAERAWIYYFENPYVPEFDTDGKPSVFYLSQDNVYLVHPNNLGWFLDGIKLAGYVPVLLSREEWAKRSMAREEKMGWIV